MSRALSSSVVVAAACAPRAAAGPRGVGRASSTTTNATTNATATTRGERWTPAVTLVARAYGRRASGRRNGALARASTRGLRRGTGWRHAATGRSWVGGVERKDGESGVHRARGAERGIGQGECEGDRDEFRGGRGRGWDGGVRGLLEGRDPEKALAAAWELIDEFGVEDGAVCDAAYVSELMFEGEEVAVGANAFAAHRLLSSPRAGCISSSRQRGRARRVRAIK